MKLSIKSNQIARFALVGGVNTALDFGILFALKTIGFDPLVANIISTSLAFVFSFFANKKYTFKTTDTNIRREIILFVVITLFGLWVLQSLVIQGVSLVLATAPLSGTLTLLIAKLLATVVSLTWNYLLYSRVVFTKTA